VAYSGGVDSTLMLKIAVDTLGREKVVGVTARSESLTDRAYRIACDIAREYDLPIETIEHSELAVEGYAENSPNRCYHCKAALFSHLKEEAEKRGLAVVVEGSNADDVGDYRPGMRASADLGIKSPLREFGVTKDEIRALAKQLGLPNWDRPSEACLASRFPYGQKITQEKLDKVAAAEGYLRDMGLKQVRVRHHETIARVEVLPEDMARLLEPGVREDLVEKIKALGFLYVALDMAGYRTGSMNEALPGAVRSAGANA
jgi:uncharacterized protein